MPHQLLALLAVAYIAARVGGELAHRLKLPVVVGEIVAGVVVGPAIFGWVAPDNEALEAIAELGVVFLLFSVGLETDIGELRRVGRTAMGVATAGVVLPFILGTAFMLVLGWSAINAVFIGISMVATSVGITAAVLSSQGKLQTPEAQIILGAAVFDDILTLLFLGTFTAVVGGDFSLQNLLVLAVGALGFILLVGTVGRRVSAVVLPKVGALRIGEPVVAVTIVVALALAAAAEVVGLAPLVGAFLAGVILGESKSELALEQRTIPLVEFFVPFFFVRVGMLIDTSVFGSGDGVWLVIGLVIVAVIGKFVGAAGASLSMGRRSAAIIGTGMVPRGEVGVVVASLALTVAPIESDLYGAVVAMSLITAVGAPPVLARLYAGHDEDVDGTPPPPRSWTMLSRWGDRSRRRTATEEGA